MSLQEILLRNRINVFCWKSLFFPFQNIIMSLGLGLQLYFHHTLSSGQVLQMYMEKVFQGIGRMKTTMLLIATGVFEALGQGRPSLIISLLRQFVIIVPLGWILSRFIGPTGIWISFPIAEFVAAVIAWKMMERIYSNHSASQTSS